MLFMAFKLIKDIFQEPKSKSLLWESMLSVMFSGTLLPFLFSVKPSILMVLECLIVSIPTISILAYPTIKQKKLVSKYRNSEEGLIKP